MLFASSTFLFAFLPAFLVLYFVLPTRTAKNLCLLAASLVFYAWGEPTYVALLLASIAVNWALALVLRLGGSAFSRAILALAVVFNVSLMGFYKYEGFLAGIVNGAWGAEVVPDLHPTLPIGISFYTLQALSYVVDVYRGEVEAQRNPLWLGMYLSCFPQLIAGPIVRYQHVAEQIRNRRESLEGLASGMRLFVIGLAQKTLLANTIAILANKMQGMGGAGIGLVGAWSGLLAYTFQIYFDFSGYSCMAIGLGRMMGFSYLRNFNYPYLSTSVTEFWRRWHISLSSFFRDYVYIPLGGSRCPTARWVLNLLVVWLITGLWHGAAWNYVLWGAYYGVLLVGEKLLWGRMLERMPSFLQHLYAIAIFVFGWSFFWIGDTEQLVAYWQALMGQFGLTGTSSRWELTCWEYLPVFAACAVACMPVVPYASYRLARWADGGGAKDVGDAENTSFATASIVNERCLDGDALCRFRARPRGLKERAACEAVLTLADVALVVLFVLSCMQVASGSFNPFIYFQF